MTDTPTLEDVAQQIAGLSFSKDVLAFVIAKELTDAYERGQRDAMQQWQPIETAPKDGTKIDIWIAGERRTDVRWMWSEDKPHREWWCVEEPDGDWGRMEWCNLGQTYSVAPTHWMPRPKSPKESEDD